MLEGHKQWRKANPPNRPERLSMTGRMRILIADNHEIEREGLRVTSERERSWKFCGVAKTDEASALLFPDV